MNKYKLFFALLSFTFLFAACIREEALNSEADILECKVSDPDNLIGGSKYLKLNPGSRIVKIRVPNVNTVGEQAPFFTLSQGATINPPSGTILDFSSPQHYTVTSEDKQWSKVYTVSFDDYALTETYFGFEQYELNETGKYQLIFDNIEEAGEEVPDYIWASGNAGFSLTKPDAKPEEYPTYSYEKGKAGRGVILTTCETGGLGTLVGKPLAAGNLFLGNFDLSKALNNALEATCFGIPAKISMPVSFNFWYKYQPGDIYKDVDGKQLSIIDKPSMYAVLYESKQDENGNDIQLNGSNILDIDTENILLVAQLKEEEVILSEDIRTADYVYASLPFVPQKGRVIDSNKLANGEYYLAIVFSSSFNGGFFEGAVGSTLCVDEVVVVCE